MSTPNPQHLHGMVAATHTPFHPNGALNLGVVEKQAQNLIQHRLTTAFIGGSTGESHSLALLERQQLAQRWCEVARGTPLRVMVHVGSNCLEDARALAAQADQLGALAISTLAPSHFKPANLTVLIEWCAQIAAAAPNTPFYFYDIPALTHTNFSMPDFLVQARDRIPTLRGIKFSNYDFLAYQLCLHVHDGAFDIPWGVDEFLLCALAVGARSAVGSSYNFAAPVYHRLLAAFERGDLVTARQEQFRSVQLVKQLAGYGYLSAAKAVMKMLGIDVGPTRLPNTSLTPEQAVKLQAELETLGFFEWIGAGTP
ncbi:MAG: dihydrodipicolinate synthase family protein [Verrucomicrobia bacterium]|nr:dihydrodipicolinate synthase family protein [Verrucomicrobiota bacterium]